MKKVLLVLGALVIVLSGVAMVSAYEAHTINVKAKVENSLDVALSRVNYGTVFPEEWFGGLTFSVTHSGSFCQTAQDRVLSVDYEIWSEWKPKTFDAEGNPTSWYPWLGDALWLAMEPVVDFPPYDGKINLADDTNPRSVWTNIGDPPTATPPGAGKILGPFTLTKPAAGAGDTDWWRLGLDVPVFEGYYNKWTDVETKPSGENEPTVILTGDRNVPGGIVLGVDIKIQVTGIH